MREGETAILFLFFELAYRSSEADFLPEKSEGHFLENLRVCCLHFGWKSLKIKSWLGKLGNGRAKGEGGRVIPAAPGLVGCQCGTVPTGLGDSGEGSAAWQDPCPQAACL